jgi:hypothetical protein
MRPGRMFSINTSHFSTRRLINAGARASRRSSVTLFLLRAMLYHHSEVPSWRMRQPRIGSPVPGGSTLWNHFGAIGGQQRAGEGASQQLTQLEHAHVLKAFMVPGLQTIPLIVLVDVDLVLDGSGDGVAYVHVAVAVAVQVKSTSTSRLTIHHKSAAFHGVLRANRSAEIGPVRGREPVRVRGFRRPRTGNRNCPDPRGRPSLPRTESRPLTQPVQPLELVMNRQPSPSPFRSMSTSTSTSTTTLWRAPAWRPCLEPPPLASVTPRCHTRSRALDAG